MRTWSYWMLVLVACSKSEPAPTPGSASGAVQPPIAPPPGSVEVFVDDQSVAKIGKDQIAKWPALDTLIPEDDRRLGTWKVVTLKGKSSTDLDHPSAKFPDMVPALFPGEGGAPAFGMFDRVELSKHGTPGMHADDLTEIRIKLSKEGRGGDHQGNAGGVDDPAKLKLTITTPQGDKSLTGDKIMAVPREEMPGHPDNKGWPLTKLLTAAGVTKYGKLVLVDAAGTSISLAKADFDDKSTIPFVKLNRQGSLRFRLLKKQGEGWQFGGDLRALSTIKVD